MAEVWVRAAKETDLADGSGVEFEVDGKKIALFRVDGRFYATDNVCPHRGGPLAQGSLDGPIVTCPWHGWGFDVTSGACLPVTPAKIRTYEVKVEDGDVLVQV